MRDLRSSQVLALFFLTVLGVVWPWRLSEDFLPRATVPTGDVAKTISRTGTSKPLAKAHLSKHYQRDLIDKKLSEHRVPIARCLMKNKSLSAGELKLVVTWEGSGKLQNVRLSPDGGPTVQNCLFDLILTWEVPAHSALRPFQYSRLLRFAAR